MATALKPTSLALRGSLGISLVLGPPDAGKPVPNAPIVQCRTCRVMVFSQDGSHFAFCDSQSVYVYTTLHNQLILKIDRPRTIELEFSPLNTLIATWEPYAVTKENPQGAANLNLWEIKTGKHVRGLFQKKHGGWCPQWSFDEAICSRNVSNEIHFYENNVFDTPVHKLHLPKIADFKLAHKSPPPYHVAAYVPGSKGQPSFVRAYRYPNLGGTQAAIANKSFYQADKVDMVWNNKASALLVLTATETSAESYYGDQGLHFISMAGENCLVPRGKNGPVYSVEWNPKSTDFCVVYGFMPAKATLYNLKSEPVFDFGTGPRNIVYYNPQGNIAGFGNLGGNIEFWELKSQRLIAKTEARDTTYFEWCPNGKNFLTATLAPRLRVGNGYKIWDFSGAVLHEETLPGGEELWDASWQCAASGVYPDPRPPGGATIVNQPQAAAAYVPPAMRNRPGQPAATKPKYREDYEPASNVKQQQQQQPEQMSKAALKNKKKREAKARAKEAQGSEPVTPPPPAPEPVAQAPARGDGQPAGNVEVDKKIRNLTKKLRQVQQLKEQQAAGKQLEVNQIEKLKTEADIVAELEALQFG